MNLERILIVGLGNIGLRHLGIARDFFPNSKIAILRDQKINSYKDILNIFAELIRKKIKGKKLIGEVANNEWRNIENFLNNFIFF